MLTNIARVLVWFVCGNRLIDLLEALCVQMYAEHYRRALWAGGGLPVWPRGDASGGPQQPAALPWGLCVIRLGSLEPMSTGKSVTLPLCHCTTLVYSAVCSQKRKIAFILFAFLGQFSGQLKNRKEGEWEVKVPIQDPTREDMITVYGERLHPYFTSVTAICLYHRVSLITFLYLFISDVIKLLQGIRHILLISFSLSPNKPVQ